MEKFNELVSHLEAIKNDAEKFFVKENNAAGTRLRKGLKTLADAAKGLRKHVSETKQTRKSDSGEDTTPVTDTATPA